MKVAILEGLGISHEELEALERPFIEEGVEFVEYQKTLDVEELKKETAGADAVIIANMPYPSSVISSCDTLKFIDVAFTGTDHVGLEAAREKGISVSNASGYSNEAVSELVLGMVLSFMRNISQVETRCREGKAKTGLVGCEVKGKTVGIIGLGKIGKRTAEIFNCLGATVLASSRTKHSDTPSYITEVEKEELLRESDIVVLHCPLTPETRGLIGKKELEMMKKSAILVNVARGPVVVEEDLVEALKEGEIAGALVDVFAAEPPLALSTPILSAPNTLLTPHVAFATKESMSLRAKIVFENLRAWMDGNVINKIV
ncbi:MAG: hydroxyacid dehydrogenase [Spirochaetales bacterium]|nr:hydroxyacid dehydrogenase [Spirochaetales bacterium]